MGWIVDANKSGRYENTYLSFRIYCTKEPDSISGVIEKEDGKYIRTDFIQGEYIAVDKTGLTFIGNYWDIIAKIDKESIRRVMSKRYKEELEWQSKK